MCTTIITKRLSLFAPTNGRKLCLKNRKKIKLNTSVAYVRPIWIKSEGEPLRGVDRTKLKSEITVKSLKVPKMVITIARTPSIPPTQKTRARHHINTSLLGLLFFKMGMDQIFSFLHPSKNNPANYLKQLTNNQRAVNLSFKKYTGDIRIIAVFLANHCVFIFILDSRSFEG